MDSLFDIKRLASAVVKDAYERCTNNISYVGAAEYEVGYDWSSQYGIRINVENEDDVWIKTVDRRQLGGTDRAVDMELRQSMINIAAKMPPINGHKFEFDQSSLYSHTFTFKCTKQ